MGKWTNNTSLYNVVPENERQKIIQSIDSGTFRCPEGSEGLEREGVWKRGKGHHHPDEPIAARIYRMVRDVGPRTKGQLEKEYTRRHGKDYERLCPIWKSRKVRFTAWVRELIKQKIMFDIGEVKTEVGCAESKESHLLAHTKKKDGKKRKRNRESDDTEGSRKTKTMKPEVRACL